MNKIVIITEPDINHNYKTNYVIEFIVQAYVQKFKEVCRKRSTNKVYLKNFIFTGIKFSQKIVKLIK